MPRVSRVLNRYGLAGGFLGAALVGAAAASAAPALPLVQPQARQLADQPVKNKQDKLTELQRIMPHLEHSIDILSQEGADAKHHREHAIAQVKTARDEIQREIDELEKKKAAGDIKQEHQRDKMAKKAAPKSYYDGLVTVYEYLQNSQQTLSRETGDRAGHRKKALDAMQKAQKEVQAEMDEYAAAHPNVKRK